MPCWLLLAAAAEQLLLGTKTVVHQRWVEVYSPQQLDLENKSELL